MVMQRLEKELERAFSDLLSTLSRVQSQRSAAEEERRRLEPLLGVSSGPGALSQEMQDLYRTQIGAMDSVIQAADQRIAELQPRVDAFQSFLPEVKRMYEAAMQSAVMGDEPGFRGNLGEANSLAKDRLGFVLPEKNDAELRAVLDHADIVRPIARAVVDTAVQPQVDRLNSLQRLVDILVRPQLDGLQRKVALTAGGAILAVAVGGAALGVALYHSNDESQHTSGGAPAAVAPSVTPAPTAAPGAVPFTQKGLEAYITNNLMPQIDARIKSGQLTPDQLNAAVTAAVDKYAKTVSVPQSEEQLRKLELRAKIYVIEQLGLANFATASDVARLEEQVGDLASKLQQSQLTPTSVPTATPTAVPSPTATQTPVDELASYFSGLVAKANQGQTVGMALYNDPATNCLKAVAYRINRDSEGNVIPQESRSRTFTFSKLETLASLAQLVGVSGVPQVPVSRTPSTECASLNAYGRPSTDVFGQPFVNALQQRLQQIVSVIRSEGKYGAGR